MSSSNAPSSPSSSSCSSGGSSRSSKRSARPGSDDTVSSSHGASQAAFSGGALTRRNLPLDMALRPTEPSAPSNGTICHRACGPSSDGARAENARHRSAMSRNSSGPTCTSLPFRAAHSIVKYCDSSSTTASSLSDDDADDGASGTRWVEAATSLSASAQNRCVCKRASRSSKRQPRRQSSGLERTASTYRSSHSACRRDAHARRSSS
mmetsp:Transcript_22017/g.67760  ORF Transcript_22017/g.67760 Transcript_22017/m.67760 type:complete len:208 (+) Transcript_22017:241-864(+)